MCFCCDQKEVTKEKPLCSFNCLVEWMSMQYGDQRPHFGSLSKEQELI